MSVNPYLFSAFNGKRIFLTGHTGFKGTWFLWLLRELGAEVKGYALAPETKHALFSITRAEETCISVIADIRDRYRLNEEIKEFQPDFIFHFAAQALVLPSYTDPLGTYETNVMGTANLLSALSVIQKPCATVIITTDKVYENLETEYAYREVDKLGGYDPYSSSKACCEILVSSWRRSFYPPSEYTKHRQSIATARSGNVIGGGDRSTHRIIPDLVHAFESDTPLIVRNPLSVRPWQHVLEPLRGYLMLAAHMQQQPEAFCDAYNFGPRPLDTLTVAQLVERAIAIWGSGSYCAPKIQQQPHEAGLLQLSIEKAGRELDWHPHLNAIDSIEKTIRWYLESRQCEKEYTCQQIREYLKS